MPHQAPLLTKAPSEYVTGRLNLFFLRVGENAFFPTSSVWALEKKIMYPSDFPHERPTLEQFLADIPHFQAREDLSEPVKKLILRDNCVDFYSLKD